MIENGIKQLQVIVVRFNVRGRRVQPLQFPGRSGAEAQKFASFLRVVVLLIRNLENNCVTTRRDLYYQDVGLFRGQRQVDYLVELLSKSLGLSQYQLGTCPSQKGLFKGVVRLCFDDGTETVVGSAGASSLIPYLHRCARVEIISQAKYILVVEKDAVFNSLQNDNFLITGKGFPDQLSKDFLRLVAQSSNLPVWGIGDMDPYGFDILQKYQCKKLEVPNLSITDFMGNPQDLSLRDFVRCANLLKQGIKWRVPVQRMMFFYKKAELDNIDGELCRFL